MIKTKVWICPHGRRHEVTAIQTPAVGQGSSTSTLVTAPRVCPWCKVDYRTSGK